MIVRTILIAFFSLCFAWSTAEGAVETPAESSTRPSMEFSVDNLPAGAKESADLYGITPVLKTLEDQQKILANAPADLTLDTIVRRQKLIYLRDKLNSLLEWANLQVDSTSGKVEGAISQIYELRALITEKQNHITHRNSQINLISGGATKLAGYSIALAPITAIPTNLLEIFDGGVQTTLSAMALREQRKEEKMEHGTPPILSTFLSGDVTNRVFPQLVFKYLNHPPSGSVNSQNRRQLLVANWRKAGMLDQEAKGQISVQLLDQRLAMLSDIKALVDQMHSELMDLSDAIVNSYAKDPPL